jgi:hypothetical protein
MKSLLITLVLALGVGLWLLRDSPQLKRFTTQAKQAAEQATTAAPAKPDAKSAGLRKCKRGGDVLYTNEACPPGSQEQSVKDGSLSVLPAAPKPAAASASGGLPNVRDVLAPPSNEPSMKDKQMDKIIGQ